MESAEEAFEIARRINVPDDPRLLLPAVAVIVAAHEVGQAEAVGEHLEQVRRSLNRWADAPQTPEGGFPPATVLELRGVVGDEDLRVLLEEAKRRLAAGPGGRPGYVAQVDDALAGL